jgi:hypothetical protein
MQEASIKIIRTLPNGNIREVQYPIPRHSCKTRDCGISPFEPADDLFTKLRDIAWDASGLADRGTGE